MERLRLDVAKTVSIDCIIHFICIAVGAGFPTFVAMGLREIYHSGEPNIPAVFLIDTSKDVGKDQTKGKSSFNNRSQRFCFKSNLSYQPHIQDTISKCNLSLLAINSLGAQTQSPKLMEGNGY